MDIIKHIFCFILVLICAYAEFDNSRRLNDMRDLAEDEFLAKKKRKLNFLFFDFSKNKPVRWRAYWRHTIAQWNLGLSIVVLILGRLIFKLSDDWSFALYVLCGLYMLVCGRLFEVGVWIYVRIKMQQKKKGVKKIASDLNCYSIAEKKYLVIWDELITKDSINEVIKRVTRETQNEKFSDVRTIIIAGNTLDEFQKEELIYYNNIETFVVFYLINEKLNKVYRNDLRGLALGLRPKRYYKKIEQILRL